MPTAAQRLSVLSLLTGEGLRLPVFLLSELQESLIELSGCKFDADAGDAPLRSLLLVSEMKLRSRFCSRRSDFDTNSRTARSSGE